MTIKVKFFLTFKEIFNQAETDVELKNGSTVQALLDLLCGSDEERRDSVFEKSGKLRTTINILKDGQQVDFLGGLQTELKEGDTISIFPPMAGG